MRRSLCLLLVLWPGLGGAAMAAAPLQSPSAPSAAPARADTAIQRVNALADEYLKEWLATFPEVPTWFATLRAAAHESSTMFESIQ
jgi:hypothetical protein